ncbi:endoplasmic reticulum vesicle transporter-domain-containing protein [Schizophyllum amplum]|uniref:Endoplasmic reticulum vesicle transporter-domain-containing protein n=1 Tax=Schizophyllum amplum TaxID=97359 RepID=A0A550CIK5_9AGAR|nr:endoplasmic reticulum vesicle transporter-domain-containing protein [Auriculariopsis ampla]
MAAIIDKLEETLPPGLAKLDAFPKLPGTYKTRSESRGFLTLFVGLLCFVLVLNDISEYIWGWPDYEFSVDRAASDFMNVNVDLVVNMPCRFLSVDLRDAVGDRLFLSNHGLRRDGTKFDVGQATKLKEHSKALSARQAVSQGRKSRGLFSGIFGGKGKDLFPPTYNYEAHGSACRIWGSLEVKKVTANLHITTAGHGYASREHADHKLMNLTHVISEFSFGPHFPDIVQPLDYTFEVAKDPFMAYQYYLHVVPTTYIAPRSTPLSTNQYSVTHYKKQFEHNTATPGIFFKFDLDPLGITIHQRTTSLVQLIIRIVGVVGGVFVCVSYALRVTTRAVEVVTGNDGGPALDTAEASGAKVGLRAKFGGSELRARSRVVRQGSGWAVEGAGTYGGSNPASPYVGGAPPSPYVGTPASPYVSSPFAPSFGPRTPSGGSTFGPPGGVRRQSSNLSGAAGEYPASPYAPASPYVASAGASPYVPSPGGQYASTTPYGPPPQHLSPQPSYDVFPPTPNPQGGSFAQAQHTHPPKKDD